MRLINLSLPPFAWLSDKSLADRNVLYHVRSATVLEIFEKNSVKLNPDVLSFEFTYTNIYGLEEEMMMVVHYSTTLDDRDSIYTNVIIPAIEYYCKHCNEMDKLGEYNDYGASN